MNMQVAQPIIFCFQVSFGQAPQHASSISSIADFSSGSSPSRFCLAEASSEDMFGRAPGAA